MSSTITQIPDKPTHDRIVAESIDRPTILYLSSSVLPACKSFTPQYEALAARDSSDETNVRFCQIEYSNQTSPMFKFAQAQLPVVIFMCADRYCETLLSPTIQEVDARLVKLKKKAWELIGIRVART